MPNRRMMQALFRRGDAATRAQMRQFQKAAAHMCNYAVPLSIDF